MLKQRSDLISRTPATHDSLVREVVQVHTLAVDACINGWLAITASRTDSNVWGVCQTSRRRIDETARKQVTWSIVPWLVSLLASPATAKEMMSTMATARRDAAKPTQELSEICAWYHGTVVRQLSQQGHFTADTDIAVSLSTNGFEAWRQQGFQAWPCVITALNLGSERRYKTSFQWIAVVTPGPKRAG